MIQIMVLILFCWSNNQGISQHPKQGSCFLFCIQKTRVYLAPQKNHSVINKSSIFPLYLHKNLDNFLGFFLLVNDTFVGESFLTKNRF